MDGKETRDRLLRGSVNLDRLENDVRSIIGMLRKALIAHIGWEWQLDLAIDASAFKWRVFTNRDAKDYIHFELYQGSTPWYSTFMAPPCHTSQNIQRVFEALPGLIEGVEKRFPEITYRWQYVIVASDAY